MRRRVVVTGLGVITSIGEGRDTFWRNLLDGRSGISSVTGFDTSRYSVHNGGEIPTFAPDDYVHRLNAASMGRASQFAIAASRLAIADANLAIADCDDARAGVVLGTTSGEPQFIEALDDATALPNRSEVDTTFVRKYPSHMLAAHVAAEFRLRGMSVTIPTACAAGNAALTYAADAIRSWSADVILAGGADAFSRITFAGFSRLGAIAPHRCQPFDKRRRGMIPGEGGAVLLLEALEHARARGARIYAELAGCGLSCDAHHMTAGHPAGEGAVTAMQRALADANLRPDDVSYISAHGTGTVLNDQLETAAIKRLFGRTAYRIPVSSIKSMLGHCMGAAAAIEAAACSLAVAHDRVPPTMNFEEPDAVCDLDYVPNAARDHRVDVAMNNAHGFGGNNACVLLRKLETAA